MMWKAIRIPKGLSLFAFFLPWMTVSCQGRTLVSATGAGMAFGKLQFNAPNPGVAPPEAGISLALILAMLAIAGGLFVLFKREKSSAKFALATSVGATVLIWLGTAGITKEAMLAEAAKKAEGGFAAAQAQSAMMLMEVNWHFGYYLALFSLVCAGVMEFLVMRDRDEEASKKLRSFVGNALTPIGDERGDAPAKLTCSACGGAFATGTKFCPQDGTALALPPEMD